MNNIYVRLAKTNIQNNRQLYLPYIISGIVTVMMFYLMMFINNNPGLKSIPGSVNLKTIMALGVGIITIFAYIFIFYTNSFISKRRKKEIGVYNILGMEKRHIARVLGLETVFVAMLVIVGGILSGIIFSKLILMLLYRMLGFQESVSFYIAKAGIAWAVIVFGVLYMLTLLYNLLQIRLANPIELLHGGNVGEKRAKDQRCDGSCRSRMSGCGLLYCNYHRESNGGADEIFPCSCSSNCWNLFSVYRRKYCYFENAA